MDVARTQRQQDELVVVGAGDEQRQILVLVVVAVPEGQLLIPVCRIIDGVEVEGQMFGRGRERSDELIDEQIAEAEQGGDVDDILEARQRGLTGQRWVGG